MKTKLFILTILILLMPFNLVYSESWVKAPEESFIVFLLDKNEELLRINFNGVIWVNPDIPLEDVAKRVFELLDERFHWALDECQQENEKLKKQILDLKRGDKEK